MVNEAILLCSSEYRQFDPSIETQEEYDLELESEYNRRLKNVSDQIMTLKENKELLNTLFTNS